MLTPLLFFTIGAPPFYAEDPMEVYEKILSGNPSMPTFFTRNLSDLIKKLLRSQQGKRLGNTRGGTAAVVKHKWFSSFDWASIESGEAKAPYMPTIKGKDDVTNFDQFDEGDAAVSMQSWLLWIAHFQETLEGSQMHVVQTLTFFL